MDKKGSKKKIKYNLDVEAPIEIVVKEVEIDRKAWRKELYGEM